MTQSSLIAGDANVPGLTFNPGNDGTLILQTGPNGAKVTAVAYAADGTPTFLKQPVNPVQSMIRLNTDGSYGSSSTVIRRFVNTTVSQGSDITFVDSATLGSVFTINTSGVYAISFTETAGVVSACGISLNSSQLTTGITAINASDRLACQDITTTANGVSTVNWTGYLASGSVIRPHTNGAASFTVAIAQFTIARIA